MPQINILNILQGDNQSNIVDKINYNFDQILSAGGGPQGQQGLIGPTGPIGPQGPQGPQGLQGPSGTKWFVQDSSPASGSVTGSSPWTYPSIGDYWLDPDSADQDIYVFTATGWTYTGYGLAAGQIFQKLSPVNFNGGLTGQAILIAGTASPQAVVFSDSNINGITGYAPSGTGIDNINYENSKLKIATRNDRTKIISFSHSEFDVVNTSGGASTTGNYQWNPSIDWDASSPISSAFYNIRFQNPTGAITISSLGLNGGVNLFADQEISAQSSSENIILKTAPNKGTFIDISSIGGFLELSTNSSPPANQTGAPLFANSIGLGLGLGTGEFKQTGNDSRRLAVSGNTTISKTNTYHTQDVFTGNDVGTLNVEGNVGVGLFTTPTGSPLGVSTTGPAESIGVFPLLYVTANQQGPVSQFKHAVTKGRTARTVIGGGSYEFASGNLVAGNASDISQESYWGGGVFGKGYSAGPLLSYQHKITSNTNTTNGAPVFSLTTYNYAGNYNPDTIAEKTVIQTLNSNNSLLLQANATAPGRGDQNAVSLGTNGFNKITVWGGSNSDQYGTVSIGPDSNTFKGSRIVLTGDTNANLVPTKGSFQYYNNYQTADHSLFVSGYQTIGTPDTISMFKNINGISSDGFGYNSKLKIHRNLGTSVTNVGGENFVDGPWPGNYSNGLEITSLISTKGSTFGVRPSFSLGVGAVDRLDNYNLPNNERSYASTTGFFVSDTGERVSIGAEIQTGILNSGYALNVSGASAINATGNVKIAEGKLENYIPITTPLDSPSSLFGYEFSNKLIVVPGVNNGSYNGNTLNGDVFVGSTDGVYAPLTVGAHGGAGMRFYYDGTRGVAQTVDVLRTDTDITTNTNTPGWVQVPITLYLSRDSSNNYVVGNFNSGSSGYLLYKIIGKTAIVKYVLSAVQNNMFSSGCVGFNFLLPPALQNCRNYSTLPNGENGWENANGFYHNFTTGAVGITKQRVYLRPSISGYPAWNNLWILEAQELTVNFVNASAYNEYLRGEVTIELA